MTSPIRRNSPPLTLLRSQIGVFAGLVLGLMLQCDLAPAVPIDDDPNGFEDIPWGRP